MSRWEDWSAIEAAQAEADSEARKVVPFPVPPTPQAGSIVTDVPMPDRIQETTHASVDVGRIDRRRGYLETLRKLAERLAEK